MSEPLIPWPVVGESFPVQITSLPRKSRQAVLKIQTDPDPDNPMRTVLWHFDAPPPPKGTPVVVLCNLPYIKHEVPCHGLRALRFLWSELSGLCLAITTTDFCLVDRKGGEKLC